jgi:hypothetical protein
VPFEAAVIGDTRRREAPPIDLGQVTRTVPLQRQHQRGARVPLAGMHQQAAQAAPGGHVVLPARHHLGGGRVGRDLHQPGVVVRAVDQGHHVHAASRHVGQGQDQRMGLDLRGLAIREAAELVVHAERGVHGQHHALAERAARVEREHGKSIHEGLR